VRASEISSCPSQWPPASRNPDLGAAAAKELQAAGCGTVIYHPFDLVEPESAERLAEFVANQFGKCDILVNNAAVGPRSMLRRDQIEEHPRLGLQWGQRRTCRGIKPTHNQSGLGATG